MAIDHGNVKGTAEMDVTEMLQTIQDLAVPYALQILGALVILIVGLRLARIFESLLLKGLRRSKRVDETLILFFGSMIRYAVVAFTVLAVLDQFGVKTTSLVAVLGALGLAIGLALQGTLGNVASGVMLLIFRPFKVGHYVDAGGIAGTVNAITLFSTEIDTPDNVRITVPNGAIWGAPIRNFSHHETRRVDFVFGIGYGDDIDQAMGVIAECLRADDRCLREPEPQIVVGELGASSVDIITRVWVRSADYWGVKFDMTKAVKQAFDKAGIDIPFPQRVVTVVREEETTAA